jgi:Holliday junction resolvase RusA-like endonuclease
MDTQMRRKRGRNERRTGKAKIREVAIARFIHCHFHCVYIAQKRREEERKLSRADIDN